MTINYPVVRRERYKERTRGIHIPWKSSLFNGEPFGATYSFPTTYCYRVDVCWNIMWDVVIHQQSDIWPIINHDLSDMGHGPKKGDHVNAMGDDHYRITSNNTNHRLFIQWRNGAKRWTQKKWWQWMHGIQSAWELTLSDGELKVFVCRLRTVANISITPESYEAFVFAALAISSLEPQDFLEKGAEIFTMGCSRNQMTGPKRKKTRCWRWKLPSVPKMGRNRTR